jgi:hypothetical protein
VNIRKINPSVAIVISYPFTISPASMVMPVQASHPLPNGYFFISTDGDIGFD